MHDRKANPLKLGTGVMRFPEDKIKEAILHPNLEIGARATGYFAGSYSPETV